MLRPYNDINDPVVVGAIHELPLHNRVRHTIILDRSPPSQVDWGREFSIDDFRLSNENKENIDFQM
jgi:hypothetical protein